MASTTDRAAGTAPSDRSSAPDPASMVLILIGVAPVFLMSPTRSDEQRLLVGYPTEHTGRAAA